jgi:GT2 family glycosyltransferase
MPKQRHRPPVVRTTASVHTAAVQANSFDKVRWQRMTAGYFRIRELITRFVLLAQVLLRRAREWHRFPAGRSFLPLRALAPHRLRELILGTRPTGAASWFVNTRPNRRQLNAFRNRAWPDTAPRFAVVVRTVNVAPEWLAESLRSLSEQTYGNWCAVAAMPPTPPPAVRSVLENQAANDNRFRLIAGELDVILESIGATYYCFLDHGDILEPHALYRCAAAILQEPTDLLYSDEATTGRSADDVWSVQPHPDFSYDYYLAHEYFQNLLAVRAATLDKAGGLGEASHWKRNQDLVLRVLEHARQVSHLAEVLYRRRERTAFGVAPIPEQTAEAKRRAVSRHLLRQGCRAVVRPTADPECRDVCYTVLRDGKVGVIIPTKNHGRLLRCCVESLEATVRPGQVSLLVLDHESDDPETIAYLAELRQRWTVMTYRGEFNFSAMMNAAAEQLRECEYYLFLNNDTEAMEIGWLDHMVGLAQRDEVGVVGAVLLYPDRTVQHAGVVVGFHLAADHVPKREPAFGPDGKRLSGRSHALLATRDQCAVTGACLLTRSVVFHSLGGFDERLAVGFGDTDLCLRARAAGYKVLLDSQAILLHHESATRPTHVPDPHPADTLLFRSVYFDLLLEGDPTYSPHLSYLHELQLNGFARPPDRLRARVTPVVLPQVTEAGAITLRRQAA